MRVGRRRALGLLGALGGAGLVAASGASSGCGRRREDGSASLWFSYGGTNREVLLDLVGKFNASQGRHRIVPTYQGDYFECLAKVRTAMAAKAAPTLTHVVAEVVPYLTVAGVLDPLPSLEPLAATLVRALAQAGTFERGDARPLVCLPFNRSTPIAYLNGHVLAELGLGPPSTWEELRAFALAATRRTAGGEIARYGLSCPIDWWFWVALVGQAGGELFSESGEATLGGEAGVRALALWKTLVHEDRSMRPPPGRDYNAWQVTNTDFLAGRAAMIWTSTAFLRYLEKNASFPVVAAPLPKDARYFVPTGGTMWVMPRADLSREGERARDAALAFLAFMISPGPSNEFATRTGYLPISRPGKEALAAAGHYERFPNDKIALAQLEHAGAWPFAPSLFRIQREVVQPKLEEAILLGRAPAEVLARARAEIARGI